MGGIVVKDGKYNETDKPQKSFRFKGKEESILEYSLSDFMAFLKDRTNWMYNIDYQSVIDCFKPENENDIIGSDIILMVFESYDFPPGAKQLVSHHLTYSLEDSDFANSVKGRSNKFESKDHEQLFKAFLIATIYPLYESRFEKLKLSKRKSTRSKSSLTVDSVISYPSVKQNQDLSIFTDDDYDGLIARQKWSDIVYSYLNHFSLGLVISKVISEGNQENEYRPYFVNDSFTCLSGYVLDDIKDKNFNLLLSKRSEEEQVQKIKQKLGKIEKGRIAVTCTHMDGTDFFNLLAFKPVINLKHEFSHLITVYCDIQARPACFKKLFNLEQFMEIIASMVI